MVLIIKAVVMGVVEGLTEFLPVSSTGHLIVAGKVLGLPQDEKSKAFEIFIQLGAILAVVWRFRRPLSESARGLFSDPRARRFALALGIAFLPAAIAGLIAHHWIEENLFSPASVAGALFAGGVVILAVEAWLRRGGKARFEDARAIPLTVAMWIGLAQVLSLYPGVSRSAATILAGLLVGLSRTAATEFSFYLAIPTLGAACLYSLRKVGHSLSAGDAAFYATGFVAAFISAAIVIRVFLDWVRTRDFRPFAWYRIALAIVVLLVLGRSA